MELLTEKEREYYDSLKSKGYLALGAEIHLLTLQLSIARQALEVIRDHEHCDSKSTPCAVFKGEMECMNTPEIYKLFHAGTMQGHRCCSTIADKAIEEMEACK